MDRGIRRKNPAKEGTQLRYKNGERRDAPFDGLERKGGHTAQA